MRTVIYRGRAHRLQVGSTLIERGVPTEVSDEVYETIQDRPDIRTPGGTSPRVETAPEQPETETTSGGEE